MPKTSPARSIAFQSSSRKAKWVQFAVRSLDHGHVMRRLPAVQPGADEFRVARVGDEPLARPEIEAFRPEPLVDSGSSAV